MALVGELCCARHGPGRGCQTDDCWRKESSRVGRPIGQEAPSGCRPPRSGGTCGESPAVAHSERRRERRPRPGRVRKVAGAFVLAFLLSIFVVMLCNLFRGPVPDPGPPWLNLGPMVSRVSVRAARIVFIETPQRLNVCSSATISHSCGCPGCRTLRSITARAPPGPGQQESVRVRVASGSQTAHQTHHLLG